jgi:hypothetical protein
MSDCEFSADLKFLQLPSAVQLHSQAHGTFDMFATVLCTFEGADPPTIVYTIDGLGASRILSGGECQHHHMRGSSRLGRRTTTDSEGVGQRQAASGGRED